MFNIVRQGHVTEMAFLAQAQSDYPELNIQKAHPNLDHHYATDFVVELNGRKIGVGLTLRQDEEKRYHDVSKASRYWRDYVLVVLQDDSPSSRDNALCELLEFHGGFQVIEADNDAAQIRDGRQYARRGRKTVQVEIYA